MTSDCVSYTYFVSFSYSILPFQANHVINVTYISKKGIFSRNPFYLDAFSVNLSGVYKCMCCYVCLSIKIYVLLQINLYFHSRTLISYS